MHDLTSYTWAIVGAVMALLIYVPRAVTTAIAMLLMFGPLGLLVAALVSALGCVGLWCLIVLMNKEVREGFKERAEEIPH